jgi:hypothetical protein
MPPLKPGFYAYMSPNASDPVALDRIGPFESRQAVIDWGREHKVTYRPNAEAYERAVLAWSEMTDGESDGPWFTAIHKI